MHWGRSIRFEHQIVAAPLRGCGGCAICPSRQISTLIMRVLDKHSCIDYNGVVLFFTTLLNDFLRWWLRILRPQRWRMLQLIFAHSYQKRPAAMPVVFLIHQITTSARSNVPSPGGRGTGRGDAEEEPCSTVIKALSLAPPKTLQLLSASSHRVPRFFDRVHEREPEPADRYPYVEAATHAASIRRESASFPR